MTEATLLIVADDSIPAAHIEETITALGPSSLRSRGHGGTGHHRGTPNRNHSDRRTHCAQVFTLTILQESWTHAC